jgi:acyl-CoA thioesterase YciA
LKISDCRLPVEQSEICNLKSSIGNRQSSILQYATMSSMHNYSDPAIRITLLPRDTNSRGTIFGGVILSYIDTAGAIHAHRHTHMERFVTVAMKEVIFHKPVFVGDLVSFYAETIKVGTTSITVRVIVEVERLGKSERVRVTEAEVTYVAVDAHGRKIAIG